MPIYFMSKITVSFNSSFEAVLISLSTPSLVALISEVSEQERTAMNKKVLKSGANFRKEVL
jgi:hypothetical protein